jgi:phenylacetate-CoA ligase
MYYDEKIETAPIEELKELQSKRLIDTIKRVYENVPYYREKMKALGITPDAIKSVSDLYKLPFTVKQDLRDNYPFGTFAVPQNKIARIHASSGTTGKQTVVGYTNNDIDMWATCVARCLTSVGITNDDIIQVAYGYGLFTGGLGLHYGSEKITALTVPVSGGNTKRQIQFMIDFGTTVLCCTPSYALFIADELKAMGLSKEDLSLKVGIFGAEPWSEAMKKDIENKLGLKAYDIYGLSEIIGPGVSMACDYDNGLHIMADHFIPEIINPETGEVLADGEKGELVFTCITKEALPLIRYRTRDLTSITHEVCKCGRTLPRMAKVTGRTDDMLIIRGVNVFPSQIESVLLEFAEVEPHYMIYVDRVDNLDIMTIEIEMSDAFFSDEVKQIEKLEKKLNHEIASSLGVSAYVKLVEPNRIPRSEGKAKRVLDRRVL